MSGGDKMYLIIGNGAAGIAAATALRRLDKTTPITMLTRELGGFYSRIDLPDIIAGKLPRAAAEIKSPAALAQLGIDYRTGEEVAAVCPATRTVVCASGRRYRYSKLLIATGSQPVKPAWPGIDAEGVYTLWTLPQAAAITADAEASQAAVVIGAGLIGLKTALALRYRGLKVTVVEQQPHILPRQLDGGAATIVARALKDAGIEILTEATVKGLAVEDGKVCQVEINGKLLECSLVVIAVGVRPQAELAEAAGLKVGRGIQVDKYMQTSAPEIYAAGDVAEVYDRLTGQRVVPATWPMAVEQGEIAAYNMVGWRRPFTGSINLNSVEIAGIPIVSAGDVNGALTDDVYIWQTDHAYRKVVMHRGKVKGVLLLGDIRQAGVVINLMAKQTELAGRTWPLTANFSYADLLPRIIF